MTYYTYTKKVPNFWEFEKIQSPPMLSETTVAEINKLIFRDILQ